MTAIIVIAAAVAAVAAVPAAAPRKVTVSVETTVTVHSERAATTSIVTDRCQKNCLPSPWGHQGGRQ
eukprot:20125-Heterococcus_DN1.PRE.3